jgi:hypothetical protein
MMAGMASHPRCGLYRTTVSLGELPAGRLVYFHDHGNPGPGVYLPQSWNLNRAEFRVNGITVTDAAWSSTLEPLPEEGLYAVKSQFHCCDKQCVRFEPGQLVQLGYDGNAVPILFVPEWSSRGLGFPTRGTRLDPDRLSRISLLKVARGTDSPPDAMMH